MNNSGLRQKALLATLGVVVLYAIAAILWFTTCEKSWVKSAKAYHKAKETFEKEEELISQKREWNERYESAKAEMPVFGVGKATDTTWIGKVDALAKEKLVQLSQLGADAEISAGDVQELPIQANFEASLEALVKFMHALENSDDGMYDIKAISMKPSNKRGYLKGSMSITCAYMRDKGGENEEQK